MLLAIMSLLLYALLASKTCHAQLTNPLQNTKCVCMPSVSSPVHPPAAPCTGQQLHLQHQATTIP